MMANKMTKEVHEDFLLRNLVKDFTALTTPILLRF
jgi:hypothetical protein